MPIDSSMVSEFRRKIQDVRHSRRAFGFSVVDPNVTSAIAEVTHGHLIVTVAGGVAPSFDFDLTNPRYDTIGALYQAIHRIDGYRATLDEDANLQHMSSDIEQFGPQPVNSVGIDITHHLFADSELEEILQRSVVRHNPSFMLHTVPPQEVPFVLLLAHAEVCRVQAYDATKRRGQDKDAMTLIALANNFEGQYQSDVTRLARAIHSPKEANSNIVDEGDAMLGHMVRKSMRTGFMAPMSMTIPPDAAIILDPDEHDVEDDNIRVVWQRNKNYDFYSYELWMDTRPDVVRTREGGLIFAGTPVAFLTSEDTRRSGALRTTTSIMVFRSFGANSNASRSSYATFVEEFGQLIRSFSVGNLESLSTYYFRLYVVGVNYITTSSNIVTATTKALRARFLKNNTINVARGPAGTVVTVNFDTTKGAFTASHVLKLGEKVVAPTIIAPYQVTFVVPAFENFGAKDLAVISPTQLVDVRNQAFTVTPL